MTASTPDDWREINLANWESRVPIHTGEAGYGQDAFADPQHISDVVRYDIPRLGDLTGADIVHLQCHIGTDTVSLARLGAQSVSGLDFSPGAIDAAQDITRIAGADVEFVIADTYDAVDVFGAERFDIVYTGIGAICWLPSIKQWAEVVARLLRPGGRLFMREGHPMLWAMCDPRPDNLLVVEYPYFEGQGLVFDEESTYLGEGTLASPTSVSFNHGLGEIFTALRDAGLTMTVFEEHREVPWNPLGDAMISSPDHPGEYVLAEGRDRMPMTYTVQAVKG